MTGGFRSLSIALSLGLAAGALACADRNVGQAIPADQLYYPTTVLALDTDSGNRLAILSTNLDQRFQSQQITLLNADELIDGLLEFLPTPAGQSLCEGDRPVVYSETLDLAGRRVLLGRARLPGVGGEMLSVPAPASDGGGYWLYATDRLNSGLFMVRMLDDQLVCFDPAVDEEIESNLDCGESHFFVTEAEDPFMLARGVTPAGRDFIAVGHLFGYLEGFVRFGVVTYFDEQLLIEATRGSDQSPFLFGYQVLASSGVGGLGFTPLRSSDGSLLVLGQGADPRLPFTSVELRGQGQQEGGPCASGFCASVESEIRLENFANAAGGRGLALTPDGRRAIASVRFDEPGISFNAGLVSVRLDGAEMEAQPVEELGEELGRPFLRPQGSGEPLLAYVGDLRSDQIFIVDVTRDTLRVGGVILGRAARTLSDGTVISARTLDGPNTIAFVRRNGRLYGLVTNFANSTLSVLDVTDPLPQRHCLVARLGRDVDANGDSEVSRR